ncbi:ABC transporter substrate-binding protein [Neobacillus sp. PS3-34]|uniref:ABC transporter substrate-binding protein n=1 Tax=Neobacillus sp. PS3-34 TaxID=3070678 RepID=UPI0027DFE17D|nr:ABC transporter substrate-binding protein [Neobacillus sp. PS3-34]WML49052.1 ABC transporter substrate-binding protein [Neobacillus sp. PS3-34]
MKKSKVWKKTALAVTGLALATSLAGCASATSGKDDAAKYHLPKAKITVDAETPSWKKDKNKASLNWFFGWDWFGPGHFDTPVEKYIRQDTGVDITYKSGGDDKLNSLIASGTLPDIITVDGGSPLVKELDKVAIPLDILAKKYDPYFMKHVADPSIVKFYKSADGHLYKYPNFAYTKDDYQAKDGLYGNEAFVVRKDLYEQIGSPDMSTPEGFLAALEAVKKLNAKGGDGKAVIPFGISAIGADSVGTDAWLADFLGIPTVKDGKLYDRYTDPEFVKWMKVLAKANRQGLLDPDVTTQTDATPKISNGTYFAYASANLNGDAYLFPAWANSHPSAAYEAINGPSSKEGSQTVALSGGSIAGWTRTYISKTCKNPEKAMELVTYLASEKGQATNYFGREGTDYTMVSGKAVFSDAVKDIKNNHPDQMDTKYGFGKNFSLENGSYLSKLAGIDQYSTADQQIYAWTVPYLSDTQSATAFMDANLTSEDSRNKEKIATNWAQTFVKILKAKSNADVDQAFASFKQFRDDNGNAAIEKSRNAVIAQNVKKLK